MKKTVPFILSSLLGLQAEQLDEIVEHYQDFANIEIDNDTLIRIANEFIGVYEIKLLYKCFFWYIYNQQVPGFNGVLKLR